MMDKWIEVKLSDIGKTYSGLSNKSAKDFGYGKDYIPYLNIYNNSKVNINFFEKVNIKKRENQNKVKYGDIFFTTSSETPDEVGMSSVLLDEVNEVYLNSFCFGFRLNDFNTLRPEFARYYFRGMGFRKQMNYLAQGSTRYNLSKVALLKYKAILPTIPEQSKIAEILTTIDDAIEQTEKIIEKYKRIKQGLLQDLLTKGIDENGNIRSEATHKFKDSPLGRIPVEWEVVNVNDIAIHVGSGSTPRGGQSVYLKEGILFIRSQNVSFDGLLLDDVAYIDDETHKRMKRSIVKNGDVLLNITGASLGRVCVYKELNEANVNQHVCIIRVKDKNEYNSDFLNAYLASYYGQCQIEKLIAGGNREGLNFSHIRTIKVPYFKYDEQERIVKVLETVDLSIRSYFKELNKQIAIKQGLMQDLLSGKVRVTHLLDKGGKSDECHP